MHPGSDFNGDGDIHAGARQVQMVAGSGWSTGAYQRRDRAQMERDRCHDDRRSTAVPVDSIYGDGASCGVRGGQRDHWRLRAVSRYDQRPSGSIDRSRRVAAAHGVLKAFFPAQDPALDQQRADSLATIPDDEARNDGISVGEAAAAAMIANRTNDGSAPPQFNTPPNSDPYEWQTTAGCPPAGGVFKHWPNVKPFGIESSSQFRADPPPKLTSRAYARDYNEVQAVGEINSTQRPQDRADVARLYAAQPPHVGWNSVLRQIASTRQDDISRTARTAAVMNMSLSDAHITVFESKYFYRTWRPETAIPRGDEDGNSRTAPGPFTPYIVTPCFPGYPSAHGAGGGAAREVLERAYGNRGHSITMSHPNAPGVVIHYTDLRTITDDVSDARVFGGIHFRYDQDAGERQGSDIGRYNNHNRLR